MQPILESATFAFLPDGCIPGQTCDRIRADLATSAPIPDQAVLYVCQVALTAERTEGCTHSLSCAGGEATTEDGAPLALSCTDAAVRSQYDHPYQLNATFRAEPAEPVVGDTVNVTFNVYANGGIPTFGLVGAAPFLSGPNYRNHGGWGDVTFELHADCPGSANLHVWVSYETDLGCPGDSYGNHFYGFVGGETQVFPLTVRDPPQYRISGRVAEFPAGCEGAIPGVTVTLEPLGRTVVTGDPFVFENVAPGDYTLTVTPSCTTIACWSPLPVTVSDTDVSVVLCPKSPLACPGDCNGDARVGIEELVSAVGILLGETPLASCPSLDRDDDGAVRVDELVRAVAVALNSCPVP